MDAVSSALIEPVTNSVLDLVKKHVDYIRYRQNVGELYECVEQLELDKERVDHQCNRAVKNGHKIEVKAREWSRKVGEFKTEVENYKNDEGHRKAGLTNCLFPYFRYRLGRLAKKKAVEGKKLIDGCPKPDEIAFRGNVTFNDAILSNTDLMEFDSRKSIMEDIMEKLEDPTVKMIGVHGPGGVGKSTLIKAIAGSAQVKKLFNVVAFSEITANPNVKKIQEDIAYVLGLTLEGEGENVRADSLRRRLKQEKENTLIILDDLWDRLDLNKLGIPLDDDMNGLKMKGARKPDEMSGTNKEKSLDDYKGCKILLTSRDTTVLSEKMAVKSIFGVKELEEAEAMRLLKKVTGIPDQMSHSKQEIVMKYCAGIPMAILTVGRALRNKSESVWEATLDKLKRQELVGAQYSMEISVKMSYDHLENEELKSIFLLCAQMGHQPLIMDLVKYCFGLGILEGVYSLREARDKINIWIQKLKHSGLVMLDESSSIHFNMHDMVRDAALSIAHKEKNVFTLRNGKLDDWPELERCTSISICNSDIIDELPNVINCPQLKFFQINSDDPSVKIPESFFNEMKKLRVLVLTGIHLESLPPSIKCLSNLRLLCLERCILDGNLSFIGELKKLRILSFSGSQLKKLPAELCCLDKLQLLDISNCYIVEMIPRNLISRLISLEELYIRKSLIKKLTGGETNRSGFSFLPELKHLHQLKVVDLCIPCAEVLPKDLFFDKLNDYKIVIGGFETLLVGDFRMPNKYEAFRSLALQLKDRTDNIHSQTGMKLLFKGVENLLLGELSGVQNVIDELNLDGFPCLKHLSITNNDGIKYINSMDLSHSRDVFPNLESLCLNELTNIEMICRSPVTVDSFAKLKTIKVMRCTFLKNLFSFYKDKFVSSLETIDVSYCHSLKEIFEILVNPDKVEFLKLHSLTLQSLPSFTSFYNYRVEGPSESQLTEAQTVERDEKEITIAQDERGGMSPPLFGELVEIPNLESLNLSSVRIHKIWSDQPLSSFCFQSLVKLVVEGCDNLRYLCSLSVASGLKKLKGLFVSKCRLMEKIFETEGNSADKKLTPNLQHLTLGQNELKMILHGEIQGNHLNKLKVLTLCFHVESDVFPHGFLQLVPNIEELVVCDGSFKEIFCLQSPNVDDTTLLSQLKVLRLESLPELVSIGSLNLVPCTMSFSNLTKLEVKSCNSLLCLFTSSTAKNLAQLQNMVIEFCESIKEIVSKEGDESHEDEITFPQLNCLVLGNLPDLRSFYEGSLSFPSLEELSVIKCHGMETLCPGTLKADKLLGVQLKRYSDVMPLEIDLKSTIRKAFLAKFSKSARRVSDLRLRDNPLQKIWQGSQPIPYLCFSNLHSLIVDGCQFLSDAVLPFNLLPFLTELETLEVRDCDSVKTIFDVNCTRQDRIMTTMGPTIFPLPFPLKKLVLQRLPNLENVWNDDPHRILRMQLLQQVHVEKCENLTSVFPATVAKDIVKLENLVVQHCEGLMAIVAEDNADPNGTNLELTFLCVTSLTICDLPKLKCFLQCDMLKTFSHVEPNTKNQICIEKVPFLLQLTPNLQQLTLGENELKMIPHGEFLGNLLHNLKVLILLNFSVESYEFAYGFLQQVPNIEKLEVSCSSFKEIFCFQSPNVDDTALLSQLKVLSLESLSELETIGIENTLIDLRNLETLDVSSCSVLRNLAPFPICFPNLMCLFVFECHGLENLFTYSTAKSLSRLKIMEIRSCESIKEIVSKEGDGSNEDEIIFRQLLYLNLESLPNLTSFYTGRLSFPSFLQLSVINCHCLETLSAATIWS
ncbi:hypothetical protein AAZX31_16G029800 [Glycine max]